MKKTKLTGIFFVLFSTLAVFAQETGGVCEECSCSGTGFLWFVIGGVIAGIAVYKLIGVYLMKKSEQKQHAENSISEMRLKEAKNENEEIMKKLRSVEREKGYLEDQIENVVKTMKKNDEKIYSEVSPDMRWDNVVDMFIDEMVKKEYKEGIAVGIKSFSFYFDKFTSAVKYGDSTTVLETAKQFVADYEKLSNEYKKEA